jgi:DNA-binding MarR family transcriptional regulator
LRSTTASTVPTPVNIPEHVFESVIADRLPASVPSRVSLFVYALGAGRMFERLLANAAQPHGLDGGQVSVLFALWCADPPYRRSPTQLRRLVRQSPAGVSHTIRRLHEQGLVRRMSDRNDGRANHVQLTAKGVRAVGACMNDIVEDLDEIFGATSPRQMQKYVEVQREITEIAARSPLTAVTSPRP